MNWKLAFNIAITHILTKKRQSVVAMLGVTFGISMFIIMISFMTGVNQFLQDMTMDGTPHIHIYKKIELKKTNPLTTIYNQKNSWIVIHHQKPKSEPAKLKNGLMISEMLERMPQVKGTAPQVSSQVFFHNGSAQVPGNILGIDVLKYNKLFNLESRIDKGNINDMLQSYDVILMGKGLAEKMNLEVGNRISITTPEGYNLLLKVGGIFSYGIATLDESRCFASIKTVQKIVQKDPDYITDINIKLNDLKQAGILTNELKKEFPELAIEDWETANASLLAGEKIRMVMTIVVSITLLLVAGFGIYNIMNMNILNKMKDIAILKAVGFQGRDITGIFLLQSVMIGIMGGALGLLVGYGVSYFLSITPFPEGTFFRIKTFPVNFLFKHYLMGLLFGFFTTLFAGYFPARRAAKIDPVQIIRG